MKIRNATLFGILLLSGTSAFAQESAPRIEVFGEYSYLRFNPTIPHLKNRSFNGGGANSNGYAHLSKAIVAGGGTISATGTQHPFTMALGGGLDFHINKNFSVRPIELDYVLTRYTNPFTNTNNQNNFRYTAGAVFRF